MERHPQSLQIESHNYNTDIFRNNLLSLIPGQLMLFLNARHLQHDLQRSKTHFNPCERQSINKMCLNNDLHAKTVFR